MFGPGNRDERAQARLLQRVEKPARRDVIDPQRVHAELAHLRQILFHARGRSDEIAVRVGAERAIRDSLEEELALALEEKFRAHAEALGNVVGHGVSKYLATGGNDKKSRARRTSAGGFSNGQDIPNLDAEGVG